MLLPLALVLCGALGPATAADRSYEDRLIARALSAQGRELELAPEGKRIDEVLVSSEDIIAPTDPWPQAFNWIHVRTREATVRQELLFQEGEVYRRALGEETERNLRALFIFAIARIIPVKGRTPGAVGVLVVTKDLWSIRLNTQYSVVGKLIQVLRVRPTEQNFLGRDKTLTLDFLLKLDTLSVGELFFDPRLFGTRLALLQSAAVVFNRATGVAEGSRGQLSLGLPLFSLASEWGFSVGGSWSVGRTRVYRGAEIWALPYPGAAAPVDTVPYVYDARTFRGEALYTRSLGRLYKTNLSAGLGGYGRRFTAPHLLGLTEDERGWLVANYLPLNEDAVYLTASAQLFKADYRVLHNLDTFALSEDLQLGHWISAQVRWANPAFGSPSRFVEGGVASRYRWLWRDDLLTVSVAAAVRYMPQVPVAAVTAPWVNRRFAAEVLNYSPELPGRLVARALVELRGQDLNHGIDLLGGDNGLRGLSPEALTGVNELLFNLEYRTPPIELWTLHLGGVLFWDAGTAYDSSPQLVHTVGIGLRALFPQFDIQTVRIDFGYALNGPVTPFLDRLSSTFGQITDVRPSLLTQPLN